MWDRVKLGMDTISKYLDTISKYLDNILLHSEEEKYWKIKLQNKVFQVRLRPQDLCLARPPQLRSHTGPEGAGVAGLQAAGGLLQGCGLRQQRVLAGGEGQLCEHRSCTTCACCLLARPWCLFLFAGEDSP